MSLWPSLPAVLEVQRKAALDVLRIAFEWSDRKQQAQADAEAAAAAKKPEPVVVEHRLTGSHLAQLSEDALARVCRELGWDDYDDDHEKPCPDPTGTVPVAACAAASYPEYSVAAPSP